MQYAAILYKCNFWEGNHGKRDKQFISLIRKLQFSDLPGGIAHCSEFSKDESSALVQLLCQKTLRNSGNLEGSETVTLRKFPLIWSQALSKSHLQLAHSHNYATANSARGYFSEGEESRRNWPPDSRKGQAKRRRKEWSQLSNLGLVLVESAFLLFFLVANDIPESRSRRKKSFLGLGQTQLARFPFLVISWQQELEIYSDFHLQYRGKI